MKDLTNIMKCTFRSRVWLTIVLGSMLALLAINTPLLAGKGNAGNPKILPPQSRAHGGTYSEWAGAWWRWAYSFPGGEDQNPVQDPTGDLAGLGQSGPVWFLAGSFGETVTRTVTLPPGKTLFFPIINTVWVNLPDYGDDPWSDEQRDFAREVIAPFIDGAFNLSCQIDGVEVMNIGNYRCTTQDGDEYMITLPEDNLWGLPPGVYGPSVDDGIYLMVAPLPPGQHTIRFTAETFDFWGNPFALDVTYDLTVKK